MFYHATWDRATVKGPEYSNHVSQEHQRCQPLNWQIIPTVTSTGNMSFSISTKTLPAVKSVLTTAQISMVCQGSAWQNQLLTKLTCPKTNSKVETAAYISEVANHEIGTFHHHSSTNVSITQSRTSSTPLHPINELVTFQLHIINIEPDFNPKVIASRSNNECKTSQIRT